MSSLFTPFSALPLRHTRATVSCCSSGHVSFIKEVAVTEPPTHLHHLLKVLQTRGETIISPGAKQGLIPLAIPLSKDSSGSVTALLRWPTAPPGYDILVRSFLVTLNYMLFEFNLLLSKNRLDMPVVEVWRSGVRLIARNVDEYIHRILVQEDAQEMSELYIASAEAGEKLYKKGAFAESQIDNLDVYVLKKVGLFPDVLEKKVLRHFDEGDHVSAMVTGEFYTRKDLFPGFGRPFVYYANILQKVGRDSEAKEAARVALKSPWWTLGCPYEEVASIAQWEDEQIEFIREKVSDEGRFEDLKKGKDPIQVALDVAAFLLDLASIEGTWSESLHHIAKCYEEAGLKDMSNFILYTDDK
ncbi:protein IN CHLOROPLAST ATPASE BIOGENESIS, chloroplastic-like isoform X1 [Brassica napus]|uniref:protein IN CHLOROPLAST ATPASE BIOGENESIS, chloroplastic-like isoform X1 n=1 Tax=Brassica napus TaxID=3708 RepID=UPI00207891BC|nr:protein IN CHLOROPLAST ATPASE BIOGENESIS, chloroplastic-like isoform X1 [Brassica napus]